MSFFRKIIILSYPFMMKVLKITGIGMRSFKNEKNILPAESFYSIKAVLNNGEEISFDRFKNKKILIVNLASQCAFTPQYSQLQKLYESGKNFVILGFPSNDFKKQEPGTDEEIVNFCTKKYGVTFPLFQKIMSAENQKRLFMNGSLIKIKTAGMTRNRNGIFINILLMKKENYRRFFHRQFRLWI
jgi:glutathione peroxidase